ncbi:MAG: NAD-binding protein [Cyclobacteriaceae bacterium]
MKKVPFNVRAKYQFDNFIARGSASLISWLGILSIIVIVIFAVFVWMVGLSPDPQESFISTVWVNTIHMLDPGVIGAAEQYWGYRVFMLFVTLIGIVVMSTLIGLISNGIMDKIDELRKGRSFVLEDNHVIILGWSSKIFTIIPEIVIANENQKYGSIVILADKDKVDMEDEIRDKIGDTGNTKVICRTGNPIDVDDINITNLHDSKSIIIVDKDNENSDSQIIKTIVAIVTNPKRRAKPYHITAEIESKKNYDVAKMVGKDEVELILSDDFVSKIMVQTSRQPGLSVVYIELMDFGGDEIYFVEEKTLVGKTFREVIFAFEDSAIMGIQYADNTVEVNPPMDTIMQEGDRVIGITEDDDTLVANAKTQLEIHEHRIQASPPTKFEKEKILLVGWNARARHIIRELDNYVAPGSIVRVVSKFEDAKHVLRRVADSLQNISIEFEVTDTTDRDTLEAMNMPQYDYIILLCYQEYFPIQEADAQTLITLLHLRSISDKTRRLKIVSEMLDMRNRQLADITSADDFIVSDKLLSLLMSQVSENKYLMRVFEDLFDADGSEIYIKPVENYVTLGQPVNFYTILESAARKQEVAIGYRIIADAKNAEEGYGVVVNPKKTKTVEFSAGDMIIVLSED